jgi:ArsR family transcriptional regulator, lead/cadmium/zinc/bismuth-responsive transcriptional repressor
MLEKKEIEMLQKKLTLAQEELALCEAFRILGDWSRFRIMKALLEAKELCVSDIAEIVGLSMSATSQHLRVLEMSGLVESERMGQMICYKPFLAHAKVKALIRLITS